MSAQSHAAAPQQPTERVLVREQRQQGQLERQVKLPECVVMQIALSLPEIAQKHATRM